MDIILDNSAISLLSCRRKFQLTVVNGLAPPSNTFSEFGDAFHKAIEILDMKGTADDAIAEAVKRNPKVNKVQLITAITCFHAVTKLPPAILIDDKPAIELKFKYLYGSFPTETGQLVNVYLAGTIDRIYIDPKTDTLCILDYKTAADFTTAKQQEKINEYNLAFQLPFYMYAVIKSGILPAQYLEHIANHRYRTEILFVFYTNSPPTIQKVSYNTFNDHFLYHEVPLIINHKINDAIKVINLKNTIAPHDGMCVYKACTYCAYKPACLSMGTEKEIEYLDRFDTRIYNPLTFR